MSIIGMAFIWFVGVLISDAVNDTTLHDTLKGSVNIIFLIMLVPFVHWMMYDKPSRWLYYAAGAAIAWAVSFYTGRGIEIAAGSLDDLIVWQVYFFYPGAIVIASILYYKGWHWLSYIFIELFSLWSLTCASRNIFLSMTLAVVVLIYTNNVQGNNKEERIKKYHKRIIGLVVAFIIGLFIVDTVYEKAASSGTLGDRVYQKYMMQKFSERGLASGRGDFATSLQYISKHPIFGYGSYCTLQSKKAAEATRELGIPMGDPTEFVPGHSHILGAWVYAGILGLVYWLFVIKYLLSVLRSGEIIIDTKMLGMRIYTFFCCFWNILFSPFQNRIDILLLLVNLMIFETINEKNKTTKQ